MSDVRLDNVSKRYPGSKTERPALAELDLQIPSGEFVVLVGPSGCGKSTTLRIVAGLEETSTGRVLIDGVDVTRVEPAQRDIAMVFQSYALYPHMTVFDNLAFALKLRKMPQSEIRERVNVVARSLDLQDYLERKPKALSGGQRQRVAIGRAVVRSPKVFLFDEPLSNLDAKLRAEMRREISRIHQRTQTTCLYVTHDQVEAMTLADTIVVLHEGRLQQTGSPMDIYDAPANRFVAGFFGTPAMNFLSAEVNGSGNETTANGAGFELPIASAGDNSGEVLIGIRPEALALDKQEAASSIEASVELREVLGSEVLLHCNSSAGSITLRADAHTPVNEGENVTVWIAHDKLHVFDAESEVRV